MSGPARAMACLAFAAMNPVGCANLDYARPPSDPTALVPGKEYVYGRFQLQPGSKTNPRLALDPTNLDSGAILSFALGTDAGPSLVAVAPGRYQFTLMRHAPGIAPRWPRPRTSSGFLFGSLRESVHRACRSRSRREARTTSGTTSEVPRNPRTTTSSTPG